MAAALAVAVGGSELGPAVDAGDDGVVVDAACAQLAVRRTKNATHDLLIIAGALQPMMRVRATAETDDRARGHSYGMRTMLIAAACLLATAEAAAQEERPLDHRGVDFELRPDAGMALVPRSLTNMFVGADVGIRVNRAFELALDGAWYAPFDGTPASGSPPVNESRFSAGVDFAVFPFAARARRAEGPGTFEPYALVGLGAIVTRPVAVVDPVNRRFDDQTLFDLSIGIGARLFATRWLAVDLEVRDMVYFDRMENASIAAGSTSLALSDPNNPANPVTWYDPSSHFTNAVQLRLGGSFVVGAR